MTNSHLRLVAPRTVNCTVTPRRLPNAKLRTREHLTPEEVEHIIETAKANRHGHRDALMVLLAYRHGLRAAEVVDLRCERGAPLTAPGFSRMVERAAVAADLGIKAHAHMLRHACGYKLANDGHDTRSLQAYLGHRNIQNTTRYAALAPDRFKSFWRD